MSEAQSPAAAWENVLQTRLSAPDPETGLTRFDYQGFAQSSSDRAALTAYIDALESSGEPDTPSEAVAYWANLYNAVTIDVVADNYPVDSIRDIKSGLFTPGPWKKELVEVDGRSLTLDNIEHDIMREKYPSPLIHYMVNCASVGCPNLRAQLWDASTLKADREAAARAFINSPRGVSVRNGKATVSSIYKWFEKDFGGSKSGVMEHLKTYADDDLLSALGDMSSYSGHDYDWSLNGQN